MRIMIELSDKLKGWFLRPTVHQLQRHCHSHLSRGGETNGPIDHQHKNCHHRYHYPQIIIKVIVIILAPSQVVDPFNGFWASIGWCCLLYLPAILLSVSLISLYRKVTFRIMMMVAMIMMMIKSSCLFYLPNSAS